MNRLVLYFIVILSLYFFSCSKDKDETLPTITVSLPTHLQQISGQDTVKITASFSDNNTLVNVSVSLKNASGSQVATSILKSPNTKNYQMDELYFLDDINLTSGLYYFDFMASDGENTVHKFVDVHLDEVPKQRQGIFLVNNDGSSSDVYLMDNNYNATFYKNTVGDFLALGVNSVDQRLVHSSKTSSNLVAFDVTTGSEAWNSSSISNHTGLLVENGSVYLGQNNGVIQGFNKFGSVGFNGVSSSGFYAEEAAVIGDYYFSEQQAIASSTVNLVLYWLASATLSNQATINEDILGIYSLSQNEVILITNNSTPTGNVIFYYLSTGLTSSPFSTSLGKIDACVEISSGVYLVAESNNLTLLNANTYSSLPYLNGVPASLLRYDEVTDELFVINNNQVTVYNFSTKASKGNYLHPSIVEGLEFWYNK